MGLLNTVCSGNGTQRLQLGLPVCSTTYPCTGLAPPQCIGATTLDEHRKHIERDAALERCAALLVAPPGQSDVVHTRLPALLSSMHCAACAAACTRWWCSTGLYQRCLIALLVLAHTHTCRRFQPVVVDEPTEDETLAILEGLQVS